MFLKRIRRASSISPSSNRRWNYDVFLSFRGEDTRKNFADHLYTALNKEGIVTFKDDQNLARGKSISPDLMKAIEESRFSIIIFSINYASSVWCLDELVKIVECMKEMGQTVLPVFYDVDPSEVRKQIGTYEKAFAKHEEVFMKNIEKVQRWRVAMTEVANLSGWHLQDRHESEFIQDIVKEISHKLTSVLSANQNLVGIDFRVKQMNLFLGTELDDVRVIGICGMGGIGKTTIAKVVYDMISYQFDGSSFLANIREVSERRGLVALQEQLISDILMERKINIWDVHKGVNVIKKRLRNKRVLLVLDDVDQLDQLENLAGNHDWFGLGSRVIITTRDQHLLTRHGVDKIYKVEGLNHDEALQLFCWKAFKKVHPAENYIEFSYNVVNYAQGLPLALEVLGSFLFGRSIDEWKSALDRLKEVPNRKIFEILKISYDGLEEIEKKIFLDIACFFKGKDKNGVTKILHSCDFYPDIGIGVLIDRSLITISNNKLCMHDLLQEMGREIVRQESPNKPGKRSRLWHCKDIFRVLTKNEGTEAVEGIILDFPKAEDVNLNAESFSMMNNLRLLKISNVRLSNGLEYLSNELRLLKWQEYPLSSLPSSFELENLYKLHMCHSRIEELWKGVKILSKLKLINLSHSQNLTKTPDFTGVPILERLILEGCTNLFYIHPSIGVLKRLIFLNMKNCKCLRSLPSKIEWESLEVLILSGCSKLKLIPESVKNANCLLELSLDGTAIEGLPTSIEYLTSLTSLNLGDCKNLVSLPSSLCGLRSLKILNLSGCSKLDKVPENLGHIECLEDLDLGGTAIRQPPSSIVLLKNLQVLSFKGCKGQAPTPWSTHFWSSLLARKSSASMNFLLPSVSGLCSLRRLDLSDCNLQEGALPNDLGCLSSLESLHLSGNNFISIPASISQLSKLETLNLDYCKKLQALPELPGSIDGLFAHNCTSLEALSSLSNICKSNTRIYHFGNCFKLAANHGSDSMVVTFFKCLLLSLLKSQHQGLPSAYSVSEFDIVVPGSGIPKWFNHQNRGSSISLWLPRPSHSSNTMYRGLAFCVAFAVQWLPNIYGDVLCPKKTLYFECHLKMSGKNAYRYGIFIAPDSLLESDHRWLCYASCAFSKNDLLYECNHMEASFIQNDHPYLIVKVKKCGLRLVNEHDVEEFDQTMAQSSTSPENLGVLHENFGESAVEGCTIKPRYDYRYEDVAEPIGSSSFNEEPPPKRLRGLTGFFLEVKLKFLEE